MSLLVAATQLVQKNLLVLNKNFGREKRYFGLGEEKKQMYENSEGNYIWGL
jgi:hypothetical protein